ncbi:mitogen-activated protein kinase organizer 1, putative [Plasmodium knowlesi strain H]|uniref:Mitogen-activated protein kinase organizer 1, putative n=1 Tax=Plasmodium knowlesi (strain H) TaxID=5851 RepID=A0A1A7W1E8_PLAKH|nr:mitogen-activated protein kinase organizer 1, putative [Plasmodium knowlesi strain H]SBO27727.1 mitogen-activated protein kinase organizer 1, putative [Plasmodium knowlesi strain H]
MDIDLTAKTVGKLSGHKACVTKIVFSNDENYIVSSSLDNTVCLWNVNKQLHINTYKDVHKKGINDVALFRDNTKFFSAGRSPCKCPNKVLLPDTPPVTFTLPAENSLLSFPHHTTGNDAHVYLWDTLSNKVLNRLHVNDKVNVIKLSLNEKLLFCSRSNSVLVYDFRERDYKKKNTPLQIFKEARDSISDIFVEEHEIYTGSIDNWLRVYDLRMGKMLSYDMKSSILSVDVTNDRNYFCVNCIDNNVKLVEKNSGTLLGLYRGDSNNCHRRNIKLDNRNKFILSCTHHNDLHIYDIVKSNLINNCTFYRNLEYEQNLDIYKKTYCKVPIGRPTYYVTVNRHMVLENSYIDKEKYDFVLEKYKQYGKKKHLPSFEESFQNVDNKLVCGDVDGNIHVLQLYYR